MKRNVQIALITIAIVIPVVALGALAYVYREQLFTAAGVTSPKVTLHYAANNETTKDTVDTFSLNTAIDYAKSKGLYALYLGNTSGGVDLNTFDPNPTNSLTEKRSMIGLTRETWMLPWSFYNRCFSDDPGTRTDCHWVNQLVAGTNEATKAFDVGDPNVNGARNQSARKTEFSVVSKTITGATAGSGSLSEMISWTSIDTLEVQFAYGALWPEGTSPTVMNNYKVEISDAGDLLLRKVANATPGDDNNGIPFGDSKRIGNVFDLFHLKLIGYSEKLEEVSEVEISRKEGVSVKVEENRIIFTNVQLVDFASDTSSEKGLRWQISIVPEDSLKAFVNPQQESGIFNILNPTTGYYQEINVLPSLYVTGLTIDLSGVVSKKQKEEMVGYMYDTDDTTVFPKTLDDAIAFDSSSINIFWKEDGGVKSLFSFSNKPAIIGFLQSVWENRFFGLKPNESNSRTWPEDDNKYSSSNARHFKVATQHNESVTITSKPFVPTPKGSSSSSDLRWKKIERIEIPFSVDVHWPAIGLDIEKPVRENYNSLRVESDGDVVILNKQKLRQLFSNEGILDLTEDEREAWKNSPFGSKLVLGNIYEMFSFELHGKTSQGNDVVVTIEKPWELFEVVMDADGTSGKVVSKSAINLLALVDSQKKAIDGLDSTKEMTWSITMAPDKLLNLRRPLQKTYMAIFCVDNDFFPNMEFIPSAPAPMQEAIAGSMSQSACPLQAFGYTAEEERQFNTLASYAIPILNIRAVRFSMSGGKPESVTSAPSGAAVSKPSAGSSNDFVPGSVVALPGLVGSGASSASIEGGIVSDGMMEFATAAVITDLLPMGKAKLTCGTDATKTYKVLHKKPGENSASEVASKLVSTNTGVFLDLGMTTSTRKQTHAYSFVDASGKTVCGGTFDALTFEQGIAAIYHVALGRTTYNPRVDAAKLAEYDKTENGGLTFWKNTGFDLVGILMAISLDPKYKEVEKLVNDTASQQGERAAVELIYNRFLGRPCDEAGCVFWAETMKNDLTPMGVFKKIMLSEEVLSYSSDYAQMAAKEKNIHLLFMRAFGRKADAQALAYYSGKVYRDSVNEIVNSAEFKTKTSGLTSREFVESVFLTLLERPPEKTNDYAQRIDSGTMTRDEVIRQVFESEEARNRMAK